MRHNLVKHRHITLDGLAQQKYKGDECAAETKKAPCGTFDFCFLEAIDLVRMVGDASFELATPTV